VQRFGRQHAQSVELGSWTQVTCTLPQQQQQQHQHFCDESLLSVVKNMARQFCLRVYVCVCVCAVSLNAFSHCWLGAVVQLSEGFQGSNWVTGKSSGLQNKFEPLVLRNSLQEQTEEDNPGWNWFTQIHVNNCSGVCLQFSGR